MSVGGVELVILVIVVLFLFGPTLLAFWLGYSIGRKKGGDERPGEPFTNEGARHSPTSPAVPVEPITHEEQANEQAEEGSDD